MPNIQAGKVTVFYYFGNGLGRLKAPVAVGEIDLASAISAANTNAIYGAQAGGGYKSFVPGSAFASLAALSPGEGYFVDAKTAFDLPSVLPNPNPTMQTNAIAYLQGVAPTPTPTPGGRVINTAAPLSAGLKLYYLGEENKELVTGVTGTLNNANNTTPAFTFPTVTNKKYIEAATDADYISFPVGSAAGSYTDFTLLFYGTLLPSSIGGHTLVSFSPEPNIMRLGGYLDPSVDSGSQGFFFIKSTDAANNNEAVIFDSNRFVRNVHRQIVVRRIGGVLGLYHDGVGIEASTEAIGTSIPAVLSGNLLIGRNRLNFPNAYSRVRTQVVAFYNRGLSDSEVAALFTNPFAQLV